MAGKYMDETHSARATGLIGIELQEFTSSFGFIGVVNGLVSSVVSSRRLHSNQVYSQSRASRVGRSKLAILY